MNWTFRGKEILSHSDLPGITDIVYLITFSDSTKYIGKKTIRSIRRLKPTKEQLVKRKNYVRKELKDLPFIKYEGSSKENENKIITSKEILHICSTKKAATYLEMAELVCRNALFTDEYTNLNISGTFYDNSLDGLKGSYDD